MQKTDCYISSPNGEIYTRIYGGTLEGSDSIKHDRNHSRFDDRIHGNTRNILMIHGAASDAEYFDEAARILSDNHWVITYDRNGHSRSIAADHAEYTVEAEALDAVAVIDQASSGKVTVAAASAGCLVALAAATICPEKTEKLILFEPAFAVTRETADEISRWRQKLEKLSKERKIAGALLEFVKMIGGSDPGSPSLSLKQQAGNLKNFQLFLEKEMNAFFRLSDCKTRLEKLSVPCHIIVGDKDLEGLFRRTGLEAAKVLGTRPIFAAGYHNFPKDHPDRFAGIVRRLAV